VKIRTFEILSNRGCLVLAFLAMLAATGCQTATGPTTATPLSAAQTMVARRPDAKFADQLAAATGIRMVPIPAGTFLMGSPADESGRKANEGPQTTVTLTHDFYLGATDVTQAQWKALMGGNPSVYKGDARPVERVSWNDATAFCEKLTAREQAAGRLPADCAYTLPTEAQWEYACRAGTTGPHAGDLDAMAWYSSNSNNTTHPVATKLPNAWGLYDMNGNVLQWCLDRFGNYPGGSVSDPTGPASGSARVFRGGGLTGDAAACRSAARISSSPTVRYNREGFRLALTLPATAPTGSSPGGLEKFNP
jgi:formylglycine-generating enzyme required for sulfatase activity